MAISNYEVCKNIGPQGLRPRSTHWRVEDPAPTRRNPLNRIHGGKPVVIQVLNASTKVWGNGSNGGGGMPGEGPVI
jgi:hypothetical protein